MTTTHQPFVIPVFPRLLTYIVFAVVAVELFIYGLIVAVPAIWVPLLFGAFYLGWTAFVQKDSLPLIFSMLFFTAHHMLVLTFNRNLAISLLFLLIFILMSGMMWLLLHYATHLHPDHHLAYSLISGFMFAQILILLASMAHEWPIRFELASYLPTVFSYVFWRFACLSADAMLGWKQFVRVAVVVLILILVIVLGSPNVQI